MIARRLYQIALGAFPNRHRRLYTAEMLDAFDHQLADAGRTGRVAVARFVVAAIANAIAMGITERRRHHVIRVGYLFSALDFTLAWRVLLRYPGLTAVGVFGIAIGIAISVAAFTVSSNLTTAVIPLAEGERVVSLISRDASTSNGEMRVVHDYGRWRDMKSVEDLGIWRQSSRNLIVEGRPAEAVGVAEVTAAAFRVPRIDAFRGRYLVDEDFAAGAPGAIVIGYDEWVRRFGGDPGIIGTPVQLGSATYSIVGVMPEAFAFPVNHSFWIPWRVDPSAVAPRTGPSANVFGRLAAGATIESAQAELSAIDNAMAAEFPSTHEHLRASVLPYTFAFNEMDEPLNYAAMIAIQLAIVLLLIVVCVNVAILVYARTATRDAEIAVRAALGASRFRIVAQLFVEALTLAAVAAAAGVFIVSVTLPLLTGAVLPLVGGRLPFWMNLQMSTSTLVYAVSLTVLGASIIGVLPALKVTRRDVQTRLQTLSPGSGSRMRMGRMWTMLIVAQVALTIAVLPAAMFFTWDGLRLRSGNAGFASHEMLSASLALEDHAQLVAAYQRLEQSLRGDAAVRDVTCSVVDPARELAMVAQLEDVPPPADPVDYNIVEGSKAGHLVRYNIVAPNFFEAFEVPVILGRGLTAADSGTDRVVINRTMAEGVFGPGNPLGRRFKYVGESREAGGTARPMEQWFEVVGVVPDFPVNAVPSMLNDSMMAERRVYHAAAIADVRPVRIAIRVRGSDPLEFSSRLRDAAARINPDVRVTNISTTEMLVRREQGLFRLIGATVGLAMSSVVILSAAGIYALMSFTVARRRREIGIRAALGADRNRLLTGIFSRVFAQLGSGAALGMLGALGVGKILEGEMLERQLLIILPMVVVVMFAVGVVAAVGPARQGLRIQPTEALRDE